MTVTEHTQQHHLLSIDELDAIVLPAGYRTEVIRGELVMSPPPADRHQHAVSELSYALRAAIADHQPRLMVLPGVDWVIGSPSRVAARPEPDLIVAPRSANRDKTITPLLAVEVWSPSDDQRLDDHPDLTRLEGKRLDYAEAGLAHYLEVTFDPLTVTRYERTKAGLLEVADVVKVTAVSGYHWTGTLEADEPFAYDITVGDLVL